MKNKDIDETTVIADMSFLDGKHKSNNRSSDTKKPEELIKGKQLIPFIKGVLAAAFLIALVYIVVYGIVIGVMYLLFENMH